MKDQNIIYNDEYLVILPAPDLNLEKEFLYTFKNIFVLDNKKNINSQLEIIKQSNFKQLIFVDYLLEYNEIISKLKNNYIIKIIFTKSLGALSNEYNHIVFDGIMKLYKKYNIEKIGFLDDNLYQVFNNKIRCNHITLDIEKTTDIVENYDNKKIGILNNEDNPMHSFYNELSALKFNDYKASLKQISKTTLGFLELFDIKYEKEVDNKNVLNLYINFSDSVNTIFIKSMDQNVPCILGNNELLKGTKLEKYLVVVSDDSIDEISEKIDLVVKNRELILKEYEDFRKEYTKKSIKEVNEFLDYKIEIKKEKEYDNLLSIVVPVYNVEKYVGKCLDSIIKAVPNSIKDKTEILVINDGSTDNSEEVINKYKNKYPSLIKYIKKKNGGLGNVRNVALKNVTGKYIASIDSDDTINVNFFKDCLNDLENDIDIVIYDWLTVTNDAKYPTSAIEWIFKDLNKYEGLMYTTIMPSTCNKIIKKELYDELDLTFVEDKYEDFSTNPFVLLKAKKIKYYNKAYYEYFIRSDSYMRTPAGLSMINIIKEFNNRLNKYEKYCNLDLEKFKYYSMSWRIEEYIINQMYEKEKDDLKKYLDYVYDNVYLVIKDIFSNKYYEEMVEGLKEEDKKFIKNRNKAFIDKKLYDFILKEKNIKKLNAPIIYFGDK